MDWTEKYRPRTLSDVMGNSKAIQSLEAWARAWERGAPAKRAAILAGRPGCGKTTAAHALAADMAWGVIELNASDTRNAEAITRIATAGALNQTFTDAGEFITSEEGGRKLIILDEADNIHGAADRGGVRAILDTIRHTHQPILLIVNDLYALTRHSSSFKSLCQTIKFQSIQARTIKGVLKRIAAAEGLDVDEAPLEAIAQRTSGDLRSAINDLHALGEGRTSLDVDSVAAVGKRDNRNTMFDAVRKILKADDAREARRAAAELDESPDFLLQWLSENVPHEYRDPGDLARALESIARADLFLARAMRTQNYRLWAYASDLMTAGVATAKDREYRIPARYRFPLWLATMGRTRGLRRTLSSLSTRLALHCHTSVGVARADLIPLYRQLFSLDGAFAVSQTARLDLDEAEVAMLIGDEKGSKRVQQLLDAAATRAEGVHIDPAGLGVGAFPGEEDREAEKGDEEEGEAPTGPDGGDDDLGDAEGDEAQRSLLDYNG